MGDRRGIQPVENLALAIPEVREIYGAQPELELSLGKQASQTKPSVSSSEINGINLNGLMLINVQ